MSAMTNSILSDGDLQLVDVSRSSDLSRGGSRYGPILVPG